MSQRQQKEIRQIYGRDIKTEMQKRVDELVPQVSRVIKPAPRYFPKRLWYKLAGIFLNLT
jgi:hypothetical protein